MFLSQDRFIDRLIQMFRDLKVVAIAKQKISKLIQKGLAIEYMT